MIIGLAIVLAYLAGGIVTTRKYYLRTGDERELLFVILGWLPIVVIGTIWDWIVRPTKQQRAEEVERHVQELEKELGLEE